MKDKQGSASAQTTHVVLMVRPAAFGYNAQTAANNAFQRDPGTDSAEAIARRARREFDAMVAVLRAAGIEVVVEEDRPEPACPDAVFPNNWVSFHADGTIITYPMYSAIRRRERREDVLERMTERFGFSQRLNLERYEGQGFFLEGTGSLVLDRHHRVAYACLSARTDPKMVEGFCAYRGYQPVVFHARDAQGQAIYHTNVMMALGDTFVVICLACVPDPAEREALLAAFGRTGKEVVLIDREQMTAFAGNMLQVRDQDGPSYLVMSERAYRSLSEDQVRRLEEHTRLLYSPLDTIETYGGGSARCMMAEVFVPNEEEAGSP